MDIRLLQTFRGIRSVQQEQLLRFLRGRLAQSGLKRLETAENTAECWILGEAEMPMTAILLPVETAAVDRSEETDAVLAALLLAVEELAAASTLRGGVLLPLGETCGICGAGSVIRLMLTAELPLGRIVVSGGRDEALRCAVTEAAEWIGSAAVHCGEETDITVRIGSGAVSEERRVHPLAMEHGADLIREILRSRHSG